MTATSDWLQKALELQRQHFKECDITLPTKLEIECGWTSWGAGSKGQGCTVGETLPKMVSKDRTTHIYISPKISDFLEVLEIMTHELVHAHLDGEGGHSYDFQKIARKVGLVSPWVSSQAGHKLICKYGEWGLKLGKYPHAGLRAKSAGYGEPAKSYLRKGICSNIECDYTVRITTKWVKVKVPQCPIHQIDMVIDDL